MRLPPASAARRWRPGASPSSPRPAFIAGGESPFNHGFGEYRVIPDDADACEIVMSHASTNFDRTGYQQDLNICFPLDRLRELAAVGAVGSVAAFHYSFMGATPPDRLEAAARELAGHLKGDRVGAVCLVPV